MQRREFNKTLVSGAVGASLVASVEIQSASAQTRSSPVTRRRNTLMHVGADYHYVAGGSGAEITGKANLEFNTRLGVRHLTAQVSRPAADGSWDLDDLKRMRGNCDAAGVVFEAIRMDAEYIMLPPGPARDRRLDAILDNIRKASQVGVKVITYHWTVIPIRRNGERPGRGGSTYVSFKLEPNWKDLPVGRAGRVTHDDYWERITHFLERAVPVAKEHDVRLAAHPYDPPGLPFGYQGADNWDSPSIFDAYKRYEATVDSPYNGFQLCLGTTAEGLKDPAREILPIAKYLAERGKIHQVHMRNIRGGLYDFAEVYPDEGDIDFFPIMRILRDNQFAFSICADHMPSHPDDPGKLQAFAYGNGYIRALIHAVNAELAAG
jgi:mannonate dehydratase